MLPDCQLFGTLGCHLCEQAESLLLPWVARGLQVELIDIADSEQHLQAYALLIPVLRRNDSAAELRWPFDAAQLAAWLAA
jgi:hypothetical protein